MVLFMPDFTPLSVKSARPLDNYKLLVCFSTGEEKEVDISALFDDPTFSTLRDQNAFKSVEVAFGTVVWCEGTIDMAPELLYEMGTSP
jgi:hypothetical protein